jgi:transcriptional regulator with XRE-family HTH domain
VIVTKDNMREVGRFLLDARKKAGVSQKDLARRSGLTNACISALESGTNVGRLSTIVCLAEAMGMEIEIRGTGSRKETVTKNATIMAVSGDEVLEGY